MNIKPNVWGPPGWKFLHYVTLGYPNNPTNVDKINIKNFFINVGKILPCLKCRHNFEQHLIKYPLNDDVLSSRINLVKWLFNIHNEVNIKTNKPIKQFSDFMDEYTNNVNNINNNSNNNGYDSDNNDKSNNSFNKYLLLLIVILFLISLIIFVYLNYLNY